MSKLRVLFVHGLESHPDSSKVRLLRAQGFEVHAADMRGPLGEVLRAGPEVAPEAVARCFDACVAIQRRALEEAAPDVVVGSSWGGAVTVELLRLGAWEGPTILLAPAAHRAAVWSGRPAPVLAAPGPVLVFHDPTDDTVPHADSVQLVEGTGVELRSVDAGGHRLLGLLERGELAAAIEEVQGASSRLH